jgi:serine phosphatase RsbU (regulator of sigma subunit)
VAARDVHTARDTVERDMLRRLQAGLVPTLPLEGLGLRVLLRHEAASGLMLGGDFVDGVVRPDGTLHLVLGDVAGHGPDAAALGARLRVAWRALTLAGTRPSRAIDVLSQVVASERSSLEVFATAIAVTLPPSRDHILVVSAGHPGPIVVDQPRHAYVAPVRPTAPLGIEGTRPRIGRRIPLPPEWGLVLYSDGVFGRLARRGGPTTPEERFAHAVETTSSLRDVVDELVTGPYTDDDVTVLGLATPGLRKEWRRRELIMVDDMFTGADRRSA